MKITVCEFHEMDGQKYTGLGYKDRDFQYKGTDLFEDFQAAKSKIEDEIFSQSNIEMIDKTTPWNKEFGGVHWALFYHKTFDKTVIVRLQNREVQ